MKSKYLKGTSRHVSVVKQKILDFGIRLLMGSGPIEQLHNQTWETFVTDITETISIRYIDPSLPEIERAEGDKSDWIDLYSRLDLVLKPMECCSIPLNVAMALPEGYEAHIQARSSTYRNYGIIMVNSGVIDGAYCGNNDEWHLEALALRDCFIPKGARICQFRIMKNMPPIRFETKKRLAGKSRGGFGTTGK